jgi:hypothetical protein
MNNLFDTLLEITDSADLLDKFLNENMQAVNDFYNSDYSHIVTCKNSIERFILLKYNSIAQLDYAKSYNKSFVLMLLDYCERFNFPNATQRICYILGGNNIAKNSRQQAALLFLYPKPTYNSELVDKFDTICEKLQLAVETEEDDDSKVLATFLNYYGIIINDTSVQFAEQVKTKLTNAVENGIYSFLKHNCISEIIQLNLNDTENTYVQVQCIIDKILKKEGFVPIEIVVPQEEILIEKDTEYAIELSAIPANFDSIRNISVRKSDGQMDTNRGVKVLNSESELFVYLRRFGNMHKAKLQSAFESLPDSFSSKINIVDWGCGQGIASMIFIEKYTADVINCVTLIEPSEIAIKRASLHVKKYNPTISIKTICKKLDDLIEQDLKKTTANITIHLFSNILDIDDYKQNHLIDMIETIQSNTNYFVCVSPYIDEIKTERLESFKRYFENKYDSFELLLNIQNSKTTNDSYWNCNSNYKNCKCAEHPNCGCSSQWTRVIKVFKTE